MMINKPLIEMMGDSTKYIKRNILLQWISLLSNVVFIFSLGFLLNSLLYDSLELRMIIKIGIVVLITIAVRFICTIYATKMSYLASEKVKIILREKIYKKLLRLGISYNQKITTSSVIQVTVEGVEQLEIYFGKYLPQFFYSLLAPVTLFVILAFINLRSAIILLLCVPLIPVSIIIVQKIAKKLLAKYWGKYTRLGDSFLENLQGLTTLKIYQSDSHKHKEMNEQAEDFRKITMKVLTMQLNSITLMDLIAFGGAAVGIIVAISEFRNGNIDFFGTFVIIMLSADFFIPLRLLGSFFHIAMNGMAASDKIFKLLELKEETVKTGEIDSKNTNIAIKNLTFSYDEERTTLKNIDLDIPKNSFIAIVGESGSGKSTIASILMGIHKGYKGSVMVGDLQLSEISEASMMENITSVSHNSHLFKGTIRENLLMGNINADDNQLWETLEKVNMAEFVKSEQGLDTYILENASNLSGGQRQRLALARALLHDTPIYIFDEATSNIDVESENDIMALIHEIARTKTVILISHRLFNVRNADRIYALEKGKVEEHGTHDQLMRNNYVYAKLYNRQYELENYGSEEEEICEEAI